MKDEKDKHKQGGSICPYFPNKSPEHHQVSEKQQKRRSVPAILAAALEVVKDDPNLLPKKLLSTKPGDGKEVEVWEAGAVLAAP